MKNKLRSFAKTVFSGKFLRKMLIQVSVFFLFLELMLALISGNGWPNAPQEALYLKCEGHFSEKGNAFVADRLVTFLEGHSN